jgi:hypothetical protein
MANAENSYELKGVAPVGVWKQRILEASQRIHARDDALARQRKAVKKKRTTGYVVTAVAAAAGFFVAAPVGIGIAIAGAIAVTVLFKPPAPDFVGEERAAFVRELIALLADIAPGAPVRLAAQLDARRAVPAAALPGGSGDAEVVQEKKEAWLQGSLAAIPGLRLAWQVTEWRTVKLVRRTVRRRKTKIKEKAKFGLATRLAVRLDVDRTLFALKPVVNPQRAQDGESTVEVRERPSGWSLRGKRDLKLKTPLWSADVPDGLETLREQGKAEFFGQPAAALINLMKLCEGRLLPAAPAPAAPAKGGAA